MILIVDDDSAVRSSLSFMLKRAGYNVKVVSGPREAIDIVRAEAPALILMDMNFTLSTTGEMCIRDRCKGKVMVNVDKGYDYFKEAYEILKKTGTVNQCVMTVSYPHLMNCKCIGFRIRV